MIGPIIGWGSQLWQQIFAIDIEPMIDRGLHDSCGPLLACYIGPTIAPDYRARITARVKPPTYEIYNDSNNDNKI